MLEQVASAKMVDRSSAGQALEALPLIDGYSAYDWVRWAGAAHRSVYDMGSQLRFIRALLCTGDRDSSRASDYSINVTCVGLLHSVSMMQETLGR